MILRTELRRSAAPVIGIALVVASLGLIYLLSGPWGKGSAPWNEEWIGLAQWTRYLTLFLWPFLLGAGAFHGLRDHRSRIGELLATTPRPAWRRVLPTLGALALALTGGYLVLLVVGGVQVAMSTTYFHLTWLPVAGVMVLALVGVVYLGVGLGRLVPSLVTPPVLVVAGLAAQISVVQTTWQLLLTPAFEAPDITVLTTVAVPVTLTQALWFAAIGATGYALVVAVRARSRVAAFAPVVVAAAVVLPVLSGVTSPVVADANARELVCDTDGPRVCVTRAHGDYLPTLLGPAREALSLLRKLPSPPTSVVEDVSYDRYGGGYRPPARGVVPVFLSTGSYDEGELTDPDQVRTSLLIRAGGPVCEDRALDYRTQGRVIGSRIVALAWLTGELWQSPLYDDIWAEVGEEMQRAWRELRTLPADEQVARVAAAFDPADDCDAGLLEVP